MNAQSEHDERTMMAFEVYAKIVAGEKLTEDDLAFLRWALGITLI